MKASYDGRLTQWAVVIMDMDAVAPYDNEVVQLIVEPGYVLETYHPVILFDTEDEVTAYMTLHNMTMYDSGF